MKWLWLVWFALPATGFAILETAAINNDLPTLSQTIADLNRAWSPFGVVLGIMIGFVLGHLFWPLPKGD